MLTLTWQSAFMTIPSSERRERNSSLRRFGLYFPSFIILGIAVPVIVYLSVMQAIGWRLPQVGLNGAIAITTPTDKNMLLYASPTTTAYLAANGGKYENILVPWRSYFKDRRMPMTELHEIDKLKAFKDGVLILPSAVALDTEERAQIAAFRNRGGSILTTWATGARYDKGEWAGWKFLDSLGTKMLGEIPAEPETSNLILTGESPVSHSQLSGQRIWMSKTAERPLRLKGEMIGARIMDWARTADDQRRGEGAVVYTEIGISRSASYAFSESAWESHPASTYLLIDDTLKWLQRDTSMVLAAWPNGKSAAQIIEMDTEQGFPNALNFAAMMRGLDYRATFYVLTSVAKQYKNVLQTLAKDFDIGYHAEVHNGFKGQSAAIQDNRIKTMKADMASMLSDTRAITGFRAPLESYDATTEVMLRKYGIQHHAVDPERTEFRLPSFARAEGAEPDDALVLLPRTQRDDINMTGEKMGVEQVARALVDDLDTAIDTGALGFLSVHSQNFAPNSDLQLAMPKLIEQLKRRKAQVWLASSTQVADWWRQRNHVKLKTTPTGKRLEFEISVTGDTPVAGATLVVMLPERENLPTIDSLKVGSPVPTVVRLDDYRAAVIFSSLNPGNYAYKGTFR